jgi:hypothetical protein
VESVELCTFRVLDSGGDDSYHTTIEHKVDTETGYDLICITQEALDEESEPDVVVLSRADVLRLIGIVKGH